ncbi:DUF58 domain-containing protein [soil metagenome]
MFRSWRKQPAEREAPPPAPRELLSRVRRIELRARGLVDSRFSGEYHSVFKGQGIEFAEVREYQHGDEVRTIDWNVTARLGQPYVKRFVEERELTVLLIVDLSGSQRWGTTQRMKSDLVADVAATLALSATRNNDRVALLLVTDRIEWFVPPRKGRRHSLRIIRDLLAFQPEGVGTDLAGALDYAGRLFRSRTTVFLFSDFMLGDGWNQFSGSLARLALRHDVVAVRFTDPADRVLPAVGLLSVRDPESGLRSVINTSDPRLLAEYAQMVDAEEARARRTFQRNAVDEIALSTDQPFSAPLLGFFRGRERRRQR